MIRLSYDLTEDQPIFPGNPQNEITKRIAYETIEHVVKLFTHNGTHIDLPMHYLIDDKDITQYTIDDFIFHKPHVIHYVSKYPHEIKELPLKTGKDILLLHTGTKRNADSYPYLSTNVAKEISKYDYKCVGIDCLSITNPQYAAIGNEVHEILLHNNICILEDINLIGVKNLGKVYAVPLFIKGVEASPCTVFAEEIE